MMKNVLEYLYVYDLEVIREARDNMCSAIDDGKSVIQNALLAWYIFDRQLIEDVEDGVVAAICGKPA